MSPERDLHQQRNSAQALTDKHKMVFEFKFPDVGEGITEGQLVSWKVKVGDAVKPDQVLAEVETDKAVVEIPCPKEGTILKLHGKEGETVEVGNTLVTLGDPGEKVEETKEEPTKAEEKQETKKENEKEQKTEQEEHKDAGSVIGTIPEYEEEDDDVPVPPHKYFFLKSGEKITSLKELEEKVLSIDDDTFAQHVDQYKNEFSDWIKEVLKKDDLAEAVKKAKTKQALVAILEDNKWVKEDNVVIQDAPEVVVVKNSAGKEVKAMPGVRKLAKESGVDLEKVAPTGKHGEIKKEDVKEELGDVPKPLSSAATESKQSQDPIQKVPLKGMRKVIAERMTHSLQNTASLSHFDEADVTELNNIRKEEKEKLKEKGVHLTLLPFIIKATVQALKEHPYLNAELKEDNILLKNFYNIGIAVDIPDGLVVPVIKQASTKNIESIAREITDLATSARDKKLGPKDMQEGTFTISNVGSIGGIHATPIINYPQAAILLLGRMSDQPRVVDGQITIRKVLPISLTFDHKIVDGAEAARFVNKIKSYLEDPHLLLMEL